MNEVMKRDWTISLSFFAAAVVVVVVVGGDMPLMYIENMKKIQGVCYDAVACWVNVAVVAVVAAAVLLSYLCLKTREEIYTSYLLSIRFYYYKVAMSIVLAEVAWVKMMQKMFLLEMLMMLKTEEGSMNALVESYPLMK